MRVDPTPRNFEAILWDKDGTLVDSFSRWIPRERRLLESLCYEFAFPAAVREEAVREGLLRIGIRGDWVDPRGELARGTESSITARMAEALGSFGRVPDGQEFSACVNRHMEAIIAADSAPIELRTGTAEALAAVSRFGFPQGLATSDSRGAALKELSDHGLVGFFSFFAFGDEVPRPKPDPWCVVEFAGVLGIHPSRILVIGDTPTDAQMAAAAGAQFCAVLGGAGSREDFPPDSTVLENPGEITGLLE